MRDPNHPASGEKSLQGLKRLKLRHMRERHGKTQMSLLFSKDPRIWLFRTSCKPEIPLDAAILPF